MLTDEQVEQFNRDGFTVHPNFFSPDELSLYHEKMDEISAGNTLANHDKEKLEMEPNQSPEGTRVRRIYEPCDYYPDFKALSESDKLLDCVEQFIGPNIIFHYSKINMKPPEIGSVVEWHQDLSYYPLTNRDSLAILLYLDDADTTNGCLKVIPGRQNDPLMCHSRNGFFCGMVTEEVDDSGAVTVEGKAGAAIFMHCMVPHSSEPNRSEHSRKTLILSYRAADAFPIFDGKMTHLNEKGTRIVRGERVSTARFTMTEFPIPSYERNIASLYELQEGSRQESS